MPCDYCLNDAGVRWLPPSERCPYCEQGKTERLREALSLIGRKGGSVGTGAAKRRNVDYAALGRKGGLAGKGKRHK